MAEYWSLESNINQSRAVSLASSSPVLQSLKDALGPGDVLAFESAFELWHIDEAACAPILQSVNVVYGAHTSGPSYSIVMSEDPSLTLVENTTIQPGGELQAMSSAQVGLWTGYSASSSGAVNAQWTLPTTSTSSSCQNSNGCVIAFWVGQTAELSAQSGISQTGTYEYVFWYSWLQSWVYQYKLWYEFWDSSNDNGMVLCANANPGDSISAISNYLNGQYEISIVDSTLETECTSNHATWMGSPSEANWIGEDTYASSCDCNLPTPPFTAMSFTDMTAGGAGNIATLNPYGWSEATNVAKSSLTYVSKARPPFSWFSETYT